MDLVVDASAIVAVVLDESEKAVLIRATAGATLIAPRSLEAEIGNAFSGMFKRQRLTIEGALAALMEFRQITIRLDDLDLEGALELAATHRVYAYDAYVIACALRNECPLLTLDKKLVEVARRVGVSTIETTL